jgi:hypothetical protein
MAYSQQRADAIKLKYPYWGMQYELFFGTGLGKAARVFICAVLCAGSVGLPPLTALFFFMGSYICMKTVAVHIWTIWIYIGGARPSQLVRGYNKLWQSASGGVVSTVIKPVSQHQSGPTP